MYKINSIKELKEYFQKNNINNSNNLGNLGVKYWKNELKPIINFDLFKKPNNKEELIKLIDDNYPLLLIDTYNITDFQSLFKNEVGNKNLKSKKYWDNPVNYLGFWNTSNVKDICNCFSGQEFFNQRIFWNTKNVENAAYLFYNCEKFNQPIKLDLSNCKKIACMFYNCHNLNSRIILADLKNIKSTIGLFCGCKTLNQKIELSLSNCKYKYEMFYGCKNLEFNNIKSIINQFVIGTSNINKIEKEIKYKIPEEYKNKINQKSFYVVNLI